MSDTPSLGRSTAVMAAGTVLSRLTGFGRNFALAYALGADRLADTYILANNTPNIIYELVLGGILSGTLLPVFVSRLASDDEDEAWRGISAVWTVAAVALGVLAVLFVAVAPLFIRLYTARNEGSVAVEQLRVATQLLRLFAPQVALYGLISLSTALLQAQRRFAAPMFAPVLNNLVVIAVFVTFRLTSGTTLLGDIRGDRGALLLLGLGTTAGVLAMAAAQFPYRTALRRLRWVWEPRHEAVRTIVRLSGWTIGFVAANQVALFVVQFLANGERGGVAVYYLAFTVFLLPHGVLSVSIMSAIAPELAERWSRRDVDGFRTSVGLGLRTIAVVVVPAGLGLAVLARPIVSALLAYGALGRASARDVADTLSMMALGLVFYSCYLFLTRVYQARQDTRSLFFLYLVENGVNIVAALVLYPILGVRGLGLALAVAYAAGCVAAGLDLRRHTDGLGGRALWVPLARIVVASMVMAGAVALVNVATRGAPDVARTAIGIGAGASVFLAVARLVGVGELALLLPARVGLRRRTP